MNFKVDFSHCVLGVNSFSTARFTDVCSHHAGSSVHCLSHCAEAFWFDVIPLMDFCLVAYAFGVTKKKKKKTKIIAKTNVKEICLCLHLGVLLLQMLHVSLSVKLCWLSRLSQGSGFVLCIWTPTFPITIY